MESKKLKIAVENFLDVEYDDAFIRVKEIKKNDEIYECEQNENYYLKAIEDAVEFRDGWKCRVKDVLGKTYCIYAANDAELKYCPKLYKVPQYLDRIKDRFFYQVA